MIITLILTRQHWQDSENSNKYFDTTSIIRHLVPSTTRFRKSSANIHLCGWSRLRDTSYGGGVLEEQCKTCITGRTCILFSDFSALCLVQFSDSRTDAIGQTRRPWPWFFMHSDTQYFACQRHFDWYDIFMHNGGVQEVIKGRKGVTGSIRKKDQRRLHDEAAWTSVESFSTLNYGKFSCWRHIQDPSIPASSSSFNCSYH